MRKIYLLYSCILTLFAPTITNAQACAGVPDPVTVSGPASACANEAFTLTATGASTGTGISYDWQYFDGATWVSTGGTGTSYPVAGITAATEYRFVTTCANGGGQDISNSITVSMSPVYNCYCVSAPWSTGDGEISNVSFNAMSNSSTCSVAAPGPGSLLNQYSNFMTLPPQTVLQGAVVPFSVAANTCGGNYWSHVKIYIDYNQDGDFDDIDEEAYVSANIQYGPTTVVSGSITIPATATPGITGMRVILWETGFGGSASTVVPCDDQNNFGYGETEDYLVDIQVPVACTGTPNVATISGPSSACVNTSFTLTANGYTQGTGITYQWEVYNTTTSMWDQIPGATNPFHAVPGGITTPTDYHFVTTCANGGGQDISATYTMGITSFLNCYCASSPEYVWDGEIYNVTVGTINNNSTCATTGGAGSTLNMYSDYTASVAPAQLMQSLTYPVSVTAGACNGGSYDAWVKIWIDFDQDGEFTGVGEEVYSGTTTSGLYTPAGDIASGTILIPATATVGLTRMRVILWQETSGGPVVPCQSGDPYYYGETEDYLVDIQAAVPCSGTPNATTISGPASACPNASFTLTANGFTQGGGITYQWEVFNTATSMWDQIPNATNTVYTATGGITTPSDYQFVTTCANGGGQDVSGTYTVAITPFLNCYCASSPEYVWDGEIYNVTVGTINNTSTCATTGGPGSTLKMYSDYTTVVTPAQLMQSISYPVSVTAGACDGWSYDAWVKVWIDFDHDGQFTSIGEEVYSGTTTSGLYTPAGDIASGNILIPATALTGLTRMRVILWQETSGGPVVPCQSGDPYYYGETEDYLVDIVPAVPCSGTPNVTTISGPTSACPNASFTLTASGFTQGGGITYQWEVYNSTTSMWDQIPNATNTVYTVTGGITTPSDYQFVTTCANGGGQDISNTISVGLNPVTQCYCVPTYTNGGGADHIVNVAIGTWGNNTSAAGNVSPYYVNYTSQQPGTIAIPDMSQGLTYNLEITFGADGNQYHGVWIDFDQDGIFATTEYFSTGANTPGNGTVTVPLSIPVTAMLGNTRMRIRGGDDSQPSSSQACGASNSTYGEGEDYLVNITPTPTCLPPGTPSVVTSLATTADLQWPASTSAPADGYEWSVFPQGSGPTGMPVSSGTVAAGTTMATAGSLTANTAYTFYVRSACSPSDFSAWSSVNFTTPCATFMAPYAQTFDNSTVPGCWSNTGTGDTWKISNGPGPDYGVFGATDHTGNGGYFAWVDGSTPNGTNIILQSPVIDITSITNPRLRYYVKSYNINDAQNNKMIVSALDNGTWVTIDSIEMNFPNAGWQERAFSLSALTSATTVIRFRVNEQNTVGSSFYNDILIDDIYVESTPTCVQPINLAVANTTGAATDISWDPATGAAGYEYAITSSNTPPASGTTTSATSVTGVTFTSGASFYYYLHVRTDCGGAGYSQWSSLAFIPGDAAAGATELTVNGGCSGNPYTNAPATHAATEPYPSCNDNNLGAHSVWFKFVAPTSGSVKISTDVLPSGTLQDSKIGLFSATDVNDYTTFELIACDEDNGYNINFNSIIYAVDLTPGQTYYVQVDGYGSTTVGTFCITVDELVSSMIAAAGTCTDFQTPYGNGSGGTYEGWTSIVTDDANTRLVALVRNTSGATPDEYNGALTVNTGAVRQTAGNELYMDRNFLINNSSLSTPTDVRFFFLNTELTAFSNAVQSATGNIVAIGDLQVTKQTGTACEEDFDGANGTETLLTQTGNGTVTGGGWIEIQTSSFSNFYLHVGAYPLVAELGNIAATNVGTRNRVDWNTLSEQAGDYFEVERSIDGAAFSRIGTVSGKGKASSYSYWDNAPVNGTNFYRLKMMDVSGRFAYSQVVKATVNASDVFSVEAYPNPVSEGNVTVKVYGTAGANASVALTDVTGKLIKLVDLTDNAATVDMKGLAQGVYLLKYTDDIRTQSIKISKQ